MRLRTTGTTGYLALSSRRTITARVVSAIAADSTIFFKVNQ
jgi:hypothetical protein